MKKTIGMALLIMVVLLTIELLVVTRMITEVFDPRCLLSKNYIVAHMYYGHGKEAVRCVPDRP